MQVNSKSSSETMYQFFTIDFSAVSGIEGVSKEAAKSAAKSNQNAVQRVMTTLAEIFDADHSTP